MKRKILFITALLSLGAPIGLADESSDTEAAKDVAKTHIFGRISETVSDVVNAFESDAIKHAEISLVEEDWNIGGQFTGVIGLGESDNSATFAQINASRVDSRTTANIGLGTRFIPKDLEAIIGLNAFLDRELSSDHQRIGLGLELLSQSGALRFNSYQASSGEKTYKGIKEKALDGMDLTLSYRFDTQFQPELFYRAFEWKGDNSYKIKGREAGAYIKLSDNLKLRLSNKDDDKSKSEDKAELTYVMTFAAAENSAAVGHSESNAHRKSLREMLYQPVRRENRIRKTQIKLGVIMSSY